MFPAASNGTLLNTAFPSSLVVISAPVIVPELSVLTNLAPIICTPLSGSPVSVTCSVKTPVALIVKA